MYECIFSLPWDSISDLGRSPIVPPSLLVLPPPPKELATGSGSQSVADVDEEEPWPEKMHH